LSSVEVHLREREMVIGMYDRSRPAFYLATITECVFSRDGLGIPSPEPVLTPEYYRGKAVPAWFRITRMTAISQGEFTRAFCEPPIGDYTLYPVHEGRR